MDPVESAKAARPKEGWVPNPKARLREQVREVMRFGRYSLRTEQAYWHWMRRFILFHGKRHPREMGEGEVRSFLEQLATEEAVSASTQNQALNALVFLYGQVLHRPLGLLGDFARARRPVRLPVVLRGEEVRRLLEAMEGTMRLMARLLYGTGMRLMECLRLRVKDVDFAGNQIVVRQGKGFKDRVTVLPASAKEELQAHLARIRLLHERDRAEGCGEVWLPEALARKYPNAAREWAWQWVFPSATRSRDPRSGAERRHHASETSLQRAIKEAVRLAGITKPASCHTLRHSFATHLSEAGYDIRI